MGWTAAVMLALFLGAITTDVTYSSHTEGRNGEFTIRCVEIYTEWASSPYRGLCVVNFAGSEGLDFGKGAK